jgi:hypothetical protein
MPTNINKISVHEEDIREYLLELIAGKIFIPKD